MINKKREKPINTKSSNKDHIQYRNKGRARNKLKQPKSDHKIQARLQLTIQIKQLKFRGRRKKERK